MASQAFRLLPSLRRKALYLAPASGNATTAFNSFWRLWKSSPFSSSIFGESISNKPLQDSPQEISSPSDDYVLDADLRSNQHLEEIRHNEVQPSDQFPDSDDFETNKQKAESFVNLSTEVPPRISQKPQLGPRGIYKAILMGEVGQAPVQKILKNGRTVTIFPVGTGGMRNNRRPMDGESPQEFAEKSRKQWHRVAIYQDKVGFLAMRHMRKGSQVYLEGDIETRVFNDPSTNSVKSIREIAVRQNGRVLFMGAQ